ncbi:hypothetical protein MRX96_016021 [Rhipicephalus microplus]
MAKVILACVLSLLLVTTVLAADFICGLKEEELGEVLDCVQKNVKPEVADFMARLPSKGGYFHSQSVRQWRKPQGASTIPAHARLPGGVEEGHWTLRCQDVIGVRLYSAAASAGVCAYNRVLPKTARSWARVLSVAVQYVV